MWIKNLSNLSNEKINTFLSLIIGVLGKKCVEGGGERGWKGGGGERGLYKQNHGKSIEIS